MAAGFVSHPGTTYGPCADPCAHKDCASDREIAAAPCRVCKSPIGYGQRYYQEQSWTVFVHEACLEDEIAKPAPDPFAKINARLNSPEVTSVVAEALSEADKAELRRSNAALNGYLGNFLGGQKKRGLPAGTRGRATRNDRALGAYLVNGDPVYAGNALEAARTWVCARDGRKFEATVAKRHCAGHVEVRWSDGASVMPVQRLNKVRLAGWGSRQRSAGKPDLFSAVALRVEDLPA